MLRLHCWRCRRLSTPPISSLRITEPNLTARSARLRSRPRSKPPTRLAAAVSSCRRGLGSPARSISRATANSILPRARRSSSLKTPPTICRPCIRAGREWSAGTTRRSSTPTAAPTSPSPARVLCAATPANSRIRSGRSGSRRTTASAPPAASSTTGAHRTIRSKSAASTKSPTPTRVRTFCRSTAAPASGSRISRSAIRRSGPSTSTTAKTSPSAGLTSTRTATTTTASTSK